MDDPKKSSNKPVSPGNDKKTVEKPAADEHSLEESIPDAPELEGNKSGEETGTGESSEASGTMEEAGADQEPSPDIQDETDQERPEDIIKDSVDPYQDPYDPDNIYGDYNEYYEEEGYAGAVEPMPERPDDPYQQEEEDRAATEVVAAAGVLETKKESTAEEKADKKPGTEEEDEDEDPFEEKEKELGGRMSFLDHLDELRKRIFHAMIAVIVTFVGAWIFREYIFGFLSAPIKDVVDQLVVLRPTEPFTVYLKVSFAAAIFFAIPYIMFQVWLFIAPGLYRKEKIYALPFLFSSSILFILGGLFAYYIILPPALNFLLNEFGSEFKAMISAVEYYDFELIIIVGMGAIFQLPVIVAFLSMFGLVSPGFLWRNFKYAFLLITIIAAVVSPTTDPLNLFLWSGPMMVLYTISIGISWIFKARRDRKKRLEDEKYN